MSKSDSDELIICFAGHGCRIVNPPHDHSVSPLTFAEDMKIGDKYVVWDGINEEPFTEDMIGHLCIITINGELLSISELLAIVHKNSFVVPIIVFSCKNGQIATEKEFNGKPRGVFSYFWWAIFGRDPVVTFRHWSSVKGFLRIICLIFLNLNKP